MADNGVFSKIFESRTTRHSSSVTSMSQQSDATEAGNTGVIVPPSLRNARKKHKSKYYTRPIFKEPGSKIGQSPMSTDEEDSDSMQSGHRARNRMGIISGLRDEVGKILSSNMATNSVDAIEPLSRTQDRLRSIIGAQAASTHGNTSGKSRADLRSRNTLAQDPWYSTSMNTNSDDDRILAARRLCLGYEMERDRSDMSSIRREVKALAHEVISPTKQLEVQTLDGHTEGESRDEVAEIHTTHEISATRGDTRDDEKTERMEKTEESLADGTTDSWADQAVCSCGWF